MFTKITLSGRLGQNAEAKTAQNKSEFVILSIATQESWKNDKGEYETRTEWHRVYAWSNLSKFARTLQKGQLITLEGTLRYREVTEDVEGANFKHRVAEIHTTSMKRLSRLETAEIPPTEPTTSSHLALAGSALASSLYRSSATASRHDCRRGDGARVRRSHRLRFGIGSLRRPPQDL